MSGQPSWHAVLLEAPQADEVRALFREVFGTEMSPELWHWKYGDGRGRATGARGDDGALLAHYGGTARALWSQGRAHTGVQLGDVMVRAEVRGILTRRGPFATSAQAFIERFIGDGAPYAVGFGFPNDRAVRLGEALGLYEALGEVHELCWSGPGPGLGSGWQQVRTEPLDWEDAATAPALDALWAAMRDATGCAVLPCRDAAWWQHRFAAHPQRPYRAWWVRHRWTRRRLGAVMLRPGGEPGAAWEWMDLLAAPAHLDRMLHAARALAAGHGAPALMGWFSAPLAQRLRGLAGSADAAVRPACRYSVTRRRSSALGPQAWADAWWLTGGDTDFR